MGKKVGFLHRGELLCRIRYSRAKRETVMSFPMGSASKRCFPISKYLREDTIFLLHILGPTFGKLLFTHIDRGSVSKKWRHKPILAIQVSWEISRTKLRFFSPVPFLSRIQLLIITPCVEDADFNANSEQMCLRQNYSIMENDLIRLLPF